MNSICGLQGFYLIVVAFFAMITVCFTGCSRGLMSKTVEKERTVMENKNDRGKWISDRPNVILILTDDLGWSDLSCYGSKFNLTPNLDNLALQGIRFTDAYASSPVCSPSRASLLTGKSPARLHFTHIIQAGISHNSFWKSPEFTNYLPIGESTIASELKKVGYVTGIIGKWHIGGYGEAPEETGDPEKYGFDFNIAGSFQGQPPDYFYPYQLKWHDGRIFNLPRAPSGKTGDYLDDRLTDEAVQFIRKNKDTHFFLFLSYFLPHTSTGDRLQAKQEIVEKHKKRLGKDTVDNTVMYAAMIEHLDVNIGRIMKCLKEYEIDENTMVIFTSDNGGYVGKTTNLPLRAGKGTLYGGGIRVPLIVYWKGKIKSGSIETTPVSGYDIFPTILEIAGIQAKSEEMDGESLLPLLTGTGKLKRDAIYWHFPHFEPSTGASAIRKGDYKLIEIFDEKIPRLELYNLKDDIGETKDISREKKEITERLYQQLKKWKKNVGAQEPIPLKND